MNIYFILLLVTLGCAETLEEHTHGLTTHTHDLPDHTHPTLYESNATIVSIVPPVDKGEPSGPNIADKPNIGILAKTGWQEITVTFSERPLNVSAGLIRQAVDGAVSEWTLKGRILTITVFCADAAWPDHIYPLFVSWDSGFIVLNYYCPP